MRLLRRNSTYLYIRCLAFKWWFVGFFSLHWGTSDNKSRTLVFVNFDTQSTWNLSVTYLWLNWCVVWTVISPVMPKRLRLFFPSFRKTDCLRVKHGCNIWIWESEGCKSNFIVFQTIYHLSKTALILWSSVNRARLTVSRCVRRNDPDCRSVWGLALACLHVA